MSCCSCSSSYLAGFMHIFVILYIILFNTVSTQHNHRNEKPLLRPRAFGKDNGRRLISLPIWPLHMGSAAICRPCFSPHIIPSCASFQVPDPPPGSHPRRPPAPSTNPSSSHDVVQSDEPSAMSLLETGFLCNYTFFVFLLTALKTVILANRRFSNTISTFFVTYFYILVLYYIFHIFRRFHEMFFFLYRFSFSFIRIFMKRSASNFPYIITACCLLEICYMMSRSGVHTVRRACFIDLVWRDVCVSD